VVTRLVGIILAVAVLSSTAASAQQWPKDMTFPSGRKVRILSIDQFELKDVASGRMEWGLLLRYETKLKITDVVQLNKEIDEIWPWLKVDAEHRKLRRALIGVTDSSDDTPKNFSFKKQPDGSWSRRNPGAN
jgi:hypothetical protein